MLYSPFLPHFFNSPIKPLKVLIKTTPVGNYYGKACRRPLSTVSHQPRPVHAISPSSCQHFIRQLLLPHACHIFNYSGYLIFFSRLDRIRMWVGCRLQQVPIPVREASFITPEENDKLQAICGRANISDHPWAVSILLHVRLHFLTCKCLIRETIVLEGRSFPLIIFSQWPMALWSSLPAHKGVVCKGRPVIRRNLDLELLNIEE